jgi:cytochrome c peroxidase
MSDRWTSRLALVAAVAGCGGGGTSGAPSSGASKSPISIFSELERQIFLSQLGSLPAEAPPDPTNRYADDATAVLLGQQLFFETRYSAVGQSGPVSCATCHIPGKGFQDDRANTSEGIGFTGRHAPTIFNAAYGALLETKTVWQFWDGRKDSLWSQALGPPENPTEMGATRTKVALLIYDKYRATYEQIFGKMPGLRDQAGRPVFPETAGPAPAGMPPNPDWDPANPLAHAITQVYVNFGKAIAAYERRIVSRNSRFDQFYEEISTGSPTSDKLTASEISGLKLFVGRGGCVSCHLGPNFTDSEFHNTGVPQVGEHLPTDDRGRADGIGKVVGDDFNCRSEWSDVSDKARCEVNRLVANAGDGGGSSDLGAFKTPTLRSVASTAPYFHTGKVATLADTIEFYDRGGDVAHFVGTVDQNMRVLDLSSAEKQQLVDFLEALSGQALDTALTTPPALPD